MPRTTTALLLGATTLALLAGCTDAVDIDPGRTPSPLTPTLTTTTTATTGPEDVSFSATPSGNPGPYAIPTPSDTELARLEIDAGTPSAPTADDITAEVPGMRILSACTAAGGDDTALIVTPSDATGPYVAFTIPCDGTEYIARIGSATPLRAPYDLSSTTTEDVDSGYALLLPDNAEGTG